MKNQRASRVPPPVTARLGRRDAGAAALLFGALLVTYWPALNGGLLWDDAAHVTRPALRSLHGLWRIWFDLGATQQYYPLLHSAFWAEHWLWGDSVLGYHLANLALHWAAACLVVAIVRRLNLPGAWLAGYLFALHPVAVESVAWISEQKNTLSTVFYLASALVYLRFDRTRRRSHYWLALGFFLLALLSKTVTATLPAALLVIFWWRRGRIEWKRDVQPLLPWLAFGAAAGLLTAWVERTYIGAQGANFDLTVPARFLLAGRAIWFYLAKLVWPWPLVFVYPRWTVDTGAWWQYAFPLAAGGAAVGLCFAARRARGPLAAFLFFAGALFPVSGLLNVYPFIFSYVADHFQYLAALGIIVPLSTGVAAAAGGLPAGARRSASVAGVALLAALGALSWAHSRTFRDAETLYRATLARNPGAWMAHMNLGQFLHDRPGRLAEVIAEYRETIRLRPDYAEAHTNLGNALSELPNRLPDATAEFREALRLWPKDAEAYVGIGNVFLRQPNGLQDAIAEFQAALRIQADCEEAHVGLGNAFASLPNRLQDAIAEFQAALRIRPDLAEAHVGLGNAFVRLPNRLQDAIAEYRTAVRIRPDYAMAHNNLGNLLLVTPNRLQDAIAEYREALRIQPDYAEAQNGLGNALSTIPDRLREAIDAYREAIRIRPDYAKAHANLGTLLSGIPGRMPEAISHLETALRLNPDLGAARQALDQLRAKGALR